MRGLLLILAALLLGATAPAAPVAPAMPDQLAALVFDPDPAGGLPPRDVLSRWAAPVRLLVFGRPEDRADAAVAAAALTRATRLPVNVMSPDQVAPATPNAFLVVGDNLAATFRAELRPMLMNAFLDNAGLADSYTASVIAVQSCWVLPVWADATRTILKAAIIGMEARLPRKQAQRCINQKLAASLGLLGPGIDPKSLFTPRSPATRLSREDEQLLKAFYGPAFRVGMTRAQVLAASATAFKPSAAKQAKAPKLGR
jgi:hypothetical protein